MSIKDIPFPVVESTEEHAVYGPSGSERWMNCPGSVSLIAEVNKNRKPRPPNPYALEGTCAHELSSTCLTTGEDPKDYLGHVFNTVTVDSDMVRYCKKYIEYIDSVLLFDSILWVEVRTSMAHIEPNMLGTADAVIVHSKEIVANKNDTPVDENSVLMEVVDLKYGKGNVVEPQNNSQLKLYAIGVITHLAMNGFKFAATDRIKLTIAQPRLSHPMGRFRSDVVTIEDLRIFQREVIEKVKLSKSDNPPFGPSQKACMWCDASAVCRSYAEYNIETAKLDWADFELSNVDLKAKLELPKLLSKDELLKIYKKGRILTQWISQIESFLRDEMKRGESYDRLKLVHGRSNRVFDNVGEVEKILLTRFSEEEIKENFYSTKFLSPAQIEKVLSEEEMELIKDHIIKPPGKVTIADINDVRPAIDPNQEAIEDFTEELENE